MRLPSRLRRGIIAVAVSTAAVGGLAVATAPEAAAAACTGTTGVTVVVDFGSLGGGVKTMCAPGDPTSGLTALTGAGFKYAFVPRFPGFICQLNVKPNPCNGAPASAYWAYYHAPRKGAWTYSSVGAAGYNPKPNTVEGWSFGATRPPSIKAP